MKKYCKECKELKYLEEFYNHPQGVMGTLPRCKECIKKGRKSERERKMARINDNNRSKNKNRKLYALEKLKIYREQNPEKTKAHRLVSNYFRYNKNIRPDKCIHCGFIGKGRGKIELHHEDYSKPFNIIALCSLCHKGYHSGKIDIDKTKEEIIK